MSETRINTLIAYCKELLRNPKTKIIRVKTTYPNTGKVISDKWFTKTEYEEYKKSGKYRHLPLLRDLKEVRSE